MAVETPLIRCRGRILYDDDMLLILIGDYIVGDEGTCLVFQNDGNLVHYDNCKDRSSEEALWSVKYSMSGFSGYGKLKNGKFTVHGEGAQN